MVRPTFKPTAVQRRKVAVAAGAGMSHEEIALALGISRNTLEKHFNAELSTGACVKRLEMLDTLYTSGKKGNVTAQKAYIAMTPRISAPDPVKPPAERQDGKKAQAQVDATSAQVGSDWETLLPGALPLQ